MPDVAATPQDDNPTVDQGELEDVEGDVDTGEPAEVFPVSPDKHIGVDTNAGTPPQATDQGDEANVLDGTPDDVGGGGLEGDTIGLDDSVIIK